MESNQGLQKSQTQLGNQTQVSDKIKKSVALALERTGTPPFDIGGMCKDIETEFGDVSVDVITTAIKNGSLGRYGRTYRFCTQEVCIWIRQHLADLDSDIPKLVR